MSKKHNKSKNNKLQARRNRLKVKSVLSYIKETGGDTEFHANMRIIDISGLKKKIIFFNDIK